MRLWLKNLSLTLEDFAESAAKIIAAHEKSLDSLAKVVPDNSILDDLLAEQEGVYAVANTTYRTWINTSGEVETQLYKVTEQATWLKKVMALVGSSFELSDSDWFGFWGPWLRSACQMLGIILYVKVIVISLAHCTLSKALSVCLQPLTTKQIISLRLAHQKKNEKNDWFQNCEPEAVACDYRRDSEKKSRPVNHTQDQ